jgi:uncharacterized membrane protein
VLRLVLRQGMSLALGIAIGVGAALLLTRVIRPALRRARERSATFVAVALLLGLTALAVIWCPRCGRDQVGPAVVLRDE